MGKSKAVIVKDKGGLQALAKHMESQILDVIPRHVRPEAILKSMFIASSRNPAIYKCTQASIAKSIMGAAQLGLDCSGVLGSAYLVPYNNNKIGAYEAQLIIGYRGLIDLARRSGQIDSIEARCVFENDEFDFELGTDPKIKHKPTIDEPGDLIAVYAVARIKGQTMPQIEIMSRANIDRVRAQAKAGKFGPWVDHYAEMARKTVVRRLCKYLPLSPELIAAEQIENQPVEYATATASRSERLALDIGAVAGEIDTDDAADVDDQAPQQDTPEDLPWNQADEPDDPKLDNWDQVEQSKKEAKK